MMAKAVLLLACLAGVSRGLDNGLARTPPMGWLTWQRFRCVTDCEAQPDDCISENLMRAQADRLAADGYLDAGYNTIIIDDCWPERQRDSDGNLVPDKTRFPSGIKNLSDYVHNLGLKFGIYEDYGTHTCGGYPGIMDHLQGDAETFAKWGVDYTKIDGCYAKVAQYDAGYPAFGAELNKTGRPIAYSCSWPVYQIFKGITPNWTSIVETCNLWRHGGDIQDSWGSVRGILNYVSKNQEEFVPNAGPGHWNDPDMLIIGNFGLSFEQAKAQMALWAIMAAPLIMSNDLREISDQFKAILLNKEVIAVDQHWAGLQGSRIYNQNNLEVWMRWLPAQSNPNIRNFGVVFFDTSGAGSHRPVTTSLCAVGIEIAKNSTYKSVDLFSGEAGDAVGCDDKFTVVVNPSGVVMLRFDEQGVEDLCEDPEDRTLDAEALLKKYGWTARVLPQAPANALQIGDSNDIFQKPFPV